MRVVQMGVVLDEACFEGWTKPQSRMLLPGDFNATEGEPVLGLLSECLVDAFRALHQTDRGATWTPDNVYSSDKTLGARRLDYIFCPKAALVKRCEIVLDRPPVSDHFGLMAEIEFPTAA